MCGIKQTWRDTFYIKWASQVILVQCKYSVTLFLHINLRHMPIFFQNTKNKPASSLITNLYSQQHVLKIHFLWIFLIRLYSSCTNRPCLHLSSVFYLSVIISIQSFTIFYLQSQLLNGAFPLLPPPEVTEQQREGEKHTLCLLNNPGRICCWLHKCC